MSAQPYSRADRNRVARDERPRMFRGREILYSIFIPPGFTACGVVQADGAIRWEDTASNPMIMFLVLNTAGITLIPTSVIAIRQSIVLKQGLVGFNAADIFLPTLLGTFVSFCAGLVAVAIWQRINLFCKPVLAFFAGFAADGSAPASTPSWRCQHALTSDASECAPPQ